MPTITVRGVIYTMSTTLIHTPTENGVFFQMRKTPLIGKSMFVSPDSWESISQGTLSSQAGLLLRALDELEMANMPGDVEPSQAAAAVREEDGILLSHRYVANLGQAQAQMLTLPPCTPLCLSIQSRGIMSQSDFQLEAAWLTSQGQKAIGARRVGAMIQHMGVWQRLPVTLYDLASAIDDFNAITNDDQDERRRHLARLTAALPQQAKDQVARDGYLDSLRVFHAAALSLRLKTSRAAFDVEPVLFGRRRLEDERTSGLEEEEVPRTSRAALPLESEALLPPALHEHFIRDFTVTYPQVRSSYVLGENRYIFVEPLVREALEVVKEVRGASPEVRREFARHPQRHLQERLGERFGGAAVEAMFVVTQEYSERVVGLGLWVPTVLPWVKRAPNSWIPESFGLKVEDKSVAFSTSDEVDSAIRDIKEAMEQGRPCAVIQDVPVPAVPATIEVLESINRLVSEPEEQPDQPEGLAKDDVVGPIFIEVTENLDETRYCSYRKRVAVEVRHCLPHALRTTLKLHQQEALEWLVRMWSTGTSGALLADDMGLGKTLASLAFLSWVQQRRVELNRTRKPILIVAPTSLVGNWKQEVLTHLDERGLGECIEVLGIKMRHLRQTKGRDVDNGTSHLDVQRIQEADWVLTTYETLRDYHHSFATIPWSVAVFDEMQRAKNPTSQLTRAVKVLRADFCLGLTGTPIENSLADIWSIMDALLPGFLGDLRGFMADYGDANLEKLKLLKDRLEGKGQKTFRPMLRRMKCDTLQGLPAKTEHVEAATMPARQAQAYEFAIKQNRHGGPGASLKLLHALRMVSLHPEAPEAWISSGDDYIGWSARLARAIMVLDAIRDRREKALVFLESLDLQTVLATKLKERYQLGRLPFIINGSVPGAVRQRYVQAFQQERDGFDVMILSPKAGGVGLTLTAANHVIHLSRWWNPAVEDQCTDRIYRIGQEKDVHVYYPLAIHGQPHLKEFSFDLKLHELLERKRNMSKEVLLPPEDGREADFLAKGVMPN